MFFLQSGFIQLSYAAEFEFADTAAASFVSTKIDGLLAPRVPVAARVDLVSRQGKVCSVPGGREYLFSFFYLFFRVRKRNADPMMHTPLDDDDIYSYLRFDPLLFTWSTMCMWNVVLLWRRTRLNWIFL